MGEWNWFSPGPDQYWTQRRSTWAPKWDSGSKEWNRRQDVSSNYHLAIWKLCINLTTSLALCFLQSQLDLFGHYIKKTWPACFQPFSNENFNKNMENLIHMKKHFDKCPVLQEIIVNYMVAASWPASSRCCWALHWASMSKAGFTERGW